MPNLVLVPQSEVLTPIFQVSCPTIKEAQHNQRCVDNKKDQTELKAMCD